uniref:Vein, isoform C n=3 Tax=Drosophila melanogaster TaxID=7227 RepID=Q59E20_DROME|nr:vein, isoform C [Drosophila melanogaster]AAX52759.2 vein, isoform C [Drosophila melanogaster]|eukprot:NP_001014565.2 vein, isoform C [Drosophila melanogaster]
MYAQHLRKWSLKTKKQLMPLILLIISYMLLLNTCVLSSSATTQQQQQQQQQQQHLPRLWEGSAEESSYYIPLSSDNGSGSSESSAESGSSSSRSSSNNIDNNILSRLLSLNSNSLSSRSNVKLKPATVFDAGSSTPAQQEQHVAAVPEQQQQQQQQQQSMQKVPNTLINSQIYNLLYNGMPSEAASSKMRRHIQPSQLPHQPESRAQLPSNYSSRPAVRSYLIESYEMPESMLEDRSPEQAARSRRDGSNTNGSRQQQRTGHRQQLQQDKRDHRRQRQDQQKEQRQQQQQRQHKSGNKHQQQQQQRRKHQRKHQRYNRYCSARDPAQLAFAAPTVFQGVFKSMSADRRVNFSATMKVEKVYKQQHDLQLPTLVRLQFALSNSSGECDIYRERLMPRGMLRSGNDLQQASDISYMMFVQQTNPGNFTILGQPMRVTHLVVEAVETAVSENYTQNAEVTKIFSKPSKAIIKHGKKLRIVCEVSGQPPPKVTWFKDEKSINRKRNIYQFKHHKRRSELIVRSFNSSSDAGRYECRAKNKASKAIAKRRIMIKASPVHFPTDRSASGIPCNFDYCFHNGTCRMIPDINEVYCRCPTEYFGNRCENKWPDISWQEYDEPDGTH